MWAGWFSLILFGMAVVVFRFRTVGDGIITSDGVGSLYIQWIGVVFLLLGMSLASGIMFFIVLQDIITLILLIVALSLFLGYVAVSYLQVRRYSLLDTQLDSEYEVSAYKLLYKHFFLLFAVLLCILLLFSVIIWIYFGFL